MDWSCVMLVAILTSTRVASQQTVPCPEKCICPPVQHTVLCSSANLTSIPSEIFSNTVELHLQGNNLTMLESHAFQNLSELRTLYLSNCNLHSIHPDALEGVTGIQHLYLDSNDLQQVHQGTFSNLTNLLYLHLENNKISYLQPGIFSSLRKLIALYLNFNKLTELADGSFKGLTQLRMLDLGFNSLSNISRKAFEDVPYIHNLNLEMNNLTSFTVPIGQVIRTLRLSGNTIKRVSSIIFRRLRFVRELYLDNMGLEKISSLVFRRMRMIEVLDLRNNSLTSLAVSQIKSYTKIYLSGNPWRCDCSITALYIRLLLIDKNDPEQQVQCQSPEALKGRSLTSLNILHFNCKDISEDATTSTPGTNAESKLTTSPSSGPATTTYKVSTSTTSISTTSVNLVREDTCLAEDIDNIQVTPMGEESLEVTWSISRSHKNFQILFSDGEQEDTLHVLGGPLHVQLFHLHPGTLYTVCIVPQNEEIMTCLKPKPRQCAAGKTDAAPEQTSHIYSPRKTSAYPFVIVSSCVAAVVLVVALVFTFYIRCSNQMLNFNFQRYHNEDRTGNAMKQDTDPDNWESTYENFDDDRHIYVTASSSWGMDNDNIDCSLADPLPLSSGPKYVTL